MAVLISAGEQDSQGCRCTTSIGAADCWGESSWYAMYLTVKAFLIAIILHRPRTQLGECLHEYYVGLCPCDLAWDS